MRSPARRRRSGFGLPAWLSRAIETGVHPWGHATAPSGWPAAGESHCLQSTTARFYRLDKRLQTTSGRSHPC